MKLLRFLFIPAMALTVLAFKADKKEKKYVCTNGTIQFFSKTPVEDIDATSNSLVGAIVPATGRFSFTVPMKSFQFKKSLMQEHFNENYMESDKYPSATFSGVINEKVDLLKNGIYEVTATGKLNIHGVDQDRTIPAKLIVNKEKMSLFSQFKVKVADHKITVPSIVTQNIAEVIDVDVKGDFFLK